MTVKVLFVLTSHGDMGNTGNKTGWYLPEVVHPFEVFRKAGYTCHSISPEGGKAPLDPGSVDASKDDAASMAFLKNAEDMKLVNETKKPNEVKASDYKVIFYPGGHGPMWDLADNKAIAKLTEDVYNNGGIVSAVCHGTVGLLPVNLPSGEPLIKGKEVTSFSNEEEAICKLTDVMPFLLETALGDKKAIYQKAKESFQPHVCVSGRVVTGQNPASATPMAEAVVKLLS